MDSTNRTLSRFLKFFTGLLVIAALYLGREVLMPLALACLFTFLLNPLVNLLCRWRMPRVAGVCTVTLISFSTLALIAWFLGGELAHLANDLPNHRQNIQKRVEALQHVGDTGVIQKLRKLVGDVSQSAQKTSPANPANQTGQAAQTPEATPVPAPGEPAPATPPAASAIPPEAPAPAAAVPATSAPAPTPAPEAETMLMKGLNTVVPTLAEGLGTAAVVILFVIFMLLRLDDIGQRVARLVGYSRLTLTTKAFGESADRISRYLLMQSTVNGIYGILLGTGLALIGLPYVVLWGVLAAMFRFIPYIGPLLVAVLPISLSLAVFDGWSQPLVVLGLILGLELVTNMIMEPILYGHSVGVSDFALLLAIAFWTWLWGGIGLVLATPLTVCLVVFCKHIPSMEWVDLVMGENPPPQPHLSYYQHHLAGNENAAQALLEATAKKDGLEAALESIALPALGITRREESLDKLTRSEAEEIYQAMLASITLLDEREAAETPPESSQPDPASPASEPPQRTVQIYGRALHGEADAQALRMLAATLPPELAMEISDSPRLVGELVHELQEKKVSVICISALPQRAQLAANTLCRRLRSKLPNLKILVCHWTLPGHEFDPKPLRDSGATWVASSLKEAREILEGAIPVVR